MTLMTSSRYWTWQLYRGRRCQPLVLACIRNSSPSSKASAHMWARNGFIEHGYGTNATVSCWWSPLVTNNKGIVGPFVCVCVGGVWVLFVNFVYLKVGCYKGTLSWLVATCVWLDSRGWLLGILLSLYLSYLNGFGQHVVGFICGVMLFVFA